MQTPNPKVLRLGERLDAEIAHYYAAGTGDWILSTANRFHVRLDGKDIRFAIPVGLKDRLASTARLTRRALRYDKSNAVLNHARDGVVVLYRGTIWFYDLTRRSLIQVGTLQQCRNVLHGGIAVTKNGLYFGEYGANGLRGPVPVWGSYDDGRSWDVVYNFPAKSIKHVHGVYADPYSDSLWIPTGDFAGECFVFEVPGGNFSAIRAHGDGRQIWRPVGLFFEPERLVWAMDSQLETSYLEIFDRTTGQLTQGRDFPGPVWYSKRFTDGSAVLQTTVESGDGVKSNLSHVFYSHDLIKWTEAGAFPKDWLPLRYFKNGVIAFADGPQTPDDFVLFGEALTGLDGQIYHAQLVSE